MASANAPDNSNKFNEDDNAEERAYRRKTRQRLIIISVSSVVFVGAVLCAVIGTILPAKTSNTPRETSPSYTPQSNLDAVCNVTSHIDSCVSSISSYMKKIKREDPNPDPEDIFVFSMQVALDETTTVGARLASCKEDGNSSSDLVSRGAVDKCKMLFRDASDRINKSISSVRVSREDKTEMKINDVKKWLGESVEDQKECMERLEAAKQTMICEGIGSAVDKPTEYTGNSLAIASNVISKINRYEQKQVHRKLFTLNF